MFGIEVDYYDRLDPAVSSATALSILKSSEKSVTEIIQDWQKNSEDAKDYVNRVLGQKHMIASEFEEKLLVVRGARKFDCMHVWYGNNPEGKKKISGLETTYREKKIRQVDPKSKPNKDLYDECLEIGIPKESARMVMPAGSTRSTLILSSSVRDFLKMANGLTRSESERLQWIGNRIKDKVSEHSTIKIPQEFPATEWRIFGKESFKYGTWTGHNNSLASLSIQITRNQPIPVIGHMLRDRLNYIRIAPHEQAATEGKFYVPSAFKGHDNLIELYKELAKASREEQMIKISNKDWTFIDDALLGEEFPTDLHLHGSGAQWFAIKRLCGSVQPPMRDNAEEVARVLLKSWPNFVDEIGPGCWRNGKCLESKSYRKRCPVFGEYKGAKPKNLSVIRQAFRDQESQSRSFSVI